MRKPITALLLALIMILSVSVCSFNVQAEKTEPEVKKAEVQHLKSFLSAEPTSFDSGKAADNYALQIIMATQEPLLGIYNDKEGNIQYTQDCAAETMEISEDGLTFTFKLRENYWSDGEKVTAHDYVYGMMRNLDPATGCPYAYLLSPIKGAEAYNSGEGKAEEVSITASDDNTVVVGLKEATPHFLSIFGNPVTFAQRKDVIEKIGSEKYGSEADKTIFNGAHVVAEWVHNSKIILKKHDKYWNQAKVNYTQIDLPIVSDTNTLMSMMDTGEVRSVNTNLAEWREKFASNPEIEHTRKENPSTFFMMFNCENELFKNVKVRQAFSAALDREEFNEVIWDGNNAPATGWIPTQIFVGTINYKEKAPDYIAEAREKIADPKALLEEGLKELGRQETADELEVSICLGSTDQWFKNFGEYLQQRLAEILGVTLKVEQMDWPVFSERVDKSDYEIGYMAWGSETPEPVALLSLHLSKSNSIGTNWSNAEYDKLVMAAQHELDPEKRLDLYLKAEQILLDEVPVAPVVFSVSNFYNYKNVRDIDLCPFGNMGYRIGYLAGE